MSENLHKASSEWATRPDDERYWNVRECLAQATMERARSVQGSARSGDIRVVADEGRLLLEGKTQRAALTNWSFGQLASRAGAPAGYLASLPATLAAQNLNHGLARQNGDETKILLTKTGATEPETYTARAITSGIYERLWDEAFLRGFAELEARYGWRTPPARPSASGSARTRPATADDVLHGGRMGLSINIGDPIAPAGVYRGDRDMFVFMVDDQHTIDDGDGALARGFFFWNSEVGARSFGATTFLYRSVCGNHIVWGAKTTSEIRFRHVGAQTQGRARNILELEVKRYLQSGTETERRQINAAKLLELGKSKDEVLEAILGKRSITIPKRTLEAAYASTEEHPEDGNPRSAWGMAQGVTRISQTLSNLDARDALDRQAGKILEIAF